jgi:ABC-type lipoprotein export system ATPase subunit
MLRAENIDKTFKQGSKPVHAVKGATLTVERGERIYIHGPSGAGKSTLLQVLSGLNRPTGGAVTFGDKNIYRLSDTRRSRVRNRSFGFIFQFYHLLPELTVLENVMLPGMMKGGERRRKLKDRALELLNTVHMKERLTHRPSQLSGGESQRTAIARALINSPEVLFCDEPTGNLDSDMSGQIYALVKDISEKNNMSVILVSHQGVEKDFFNKEYYMKDGKVETMVNAGTGSI